MLTFQALEQKFGAVAAYSYLTEIERAAQIPSWAMAAVDPEVRLANAIYAQDKAQRTSAASPQAMAA